jgi:hypothetical protein
MIVFVPDLDAWLAAEVISRRTIVGFFTFAVRAIQGTAKSIYYWAFMVCDEVGS